MFGVFNFLRTAQQTPSLALLNDKAVDYDHMSEGIVWCNSGAAKLSATAPQTDGMARYYAAFNGYAEKPN